jgi:hypothetical protein
MGFAGLALDGNKENPNSIGIQDTSMPLKDPTI